MTDDIVVCRQIVIGACLTRFKRVLYTIVTRASRDLCAHKGAWVVVLVGS